MAFETANYSLSINLNGILPFSLALSEGKLIVSKGVMLGKIPLENISLELEQLFPSITRILFSREDVYEKFFITIRSNKVLPQRELEEAIREIISLELPNVLQNTATKKPMIYIPNNYFGFPLIGSIYFGVIDRGTNLLQIRAITGCPLNCPFCSVDEGPASKSKVRDFIVDSDYLLSTYNFIIREKNLKRGAEAHIDGQGEPMSYPYLIELVQGLWENPATAVVSLQTDGWFLTEQIIDQLDEVNLSRINLSINAFNPKLAKQLAGRGDYPLERILELAEYILESSSISLLLAPIWIPGINDSDIEQLVTFFSKKKRKKSFYPLFGIQNYEVYPEGRHMKGVRQRDFRLFYKQLGDLEEKLDINNLILTPKQFGMFKTKRLPIPIKQNEVLTGEMVLPGRIANEVLATAKNRLIHVRNVPSFVEGKKIKIRIIRNRHNIFFGVLS